ncbi:MAG: erythromycin esterase family protein [Ktedonobacteraceae bacterium]
MNRSVFWAAVSAIKHMCIAGMIVVGAVSVALHLGTPTIGVRSGWRRVLLLLFLPSVLMLVSCVQTTPPAQTHKLSSDPVVRWIQQHAIPLRTTDQGGSDSDLAALKQIVGNASIVGLGEETHGTHELIDIKARLTEFLISNMGFTTFVMENDWGRSQLLDAYINGGPGTITDVMSASLFGSWQTQEYLTLFEWMRAYNANAAHTTKIHFLGMDCQDFDQSDFDSVESYLQKVDPRQVAHIKDLYAPILSAGLKAAGQTYLSLAASTKQQYQNRAQQVYNFLKANRQSYIDHSSSQSFALALQNARVLVQITTYLNAQTPNEYSARFYQRDGFMAENVAWIHDYEAGNNPKIIVWAHDQHIANDTFYPSQDGRNMGGELRARYNASYLPIGTTLYQGTMRIYHYPTSSIQTITPPDPNTYNYTLGQANLPLYMLDLRTIPPGPVHNWAQSSAIFVNYGLGGEDISTPAQLSQRFDVIIHVQNTTPSRHL